MPVAADGAPTTTRSSVTRAGLSVLFFTEMWERFSYYGMRALADPLHAAPIAAGGLGFETGVAGAVYGLYTSMVYMTSLPRRLDRGPPDRPAPRRPLRRHRPSPAAISAWRSVADHLLYRPRADRRRHRPAERQRGRDRRRPLRPGGQAPRRRLLDLLHGHQPRRVHRAAGCGYLGQRISWHIGFGAAGVGMVLGIVQYLAARSTSATRGCIRPRRNRRRPPLALKSRATIGGAAALVIVIAFAFGMYSGALPVTAQTDRGRRRLRPARHRRGLLRLAVLRRRLDAAERRRLYAIAVLFVASAIFWSEFEQAGSTLNLFGDRNTRTRSSAGPSRAATTSRCSRCSSSPSRRSSRGCGSASADESRRGPAKFGLGLLFVAAASRSSSSPRNCRPTASRSPLVAGRHLPFAHLGRAVAHPGRPERDSKLAPKRVVGLMVSLILSFPVFFFFSLLSSLRSLLDLF